MLFRSAKVAAKIPEPMPRPVAKPKPTAVAHNKPAQKPAVQQAKTTEPAPPLRTAYSTPVTNANGLLSGAQPTVPTGSFEARWDALR